MNTEYYRVLLQTIKAGSITRAAEQMGYTQSGVSRMIRRMEEELQVKLVERRRDGVSANGEAEPLLERMEMIVALEEQIQKAASGLAGSHRERISIGCFQSFSTTLLPGILQGYLGQHQNLDFDVHVCDTYTELERTVRSGDLDLAFLADGFAGELVFYPLFQDRYYAIVNQNDEAAQLDSISMQDLVKEHFIIPDNAMFNSGVTEFLEKENISESMIRLNVLNDTTTIAMVSSGMGRSIVPGLFLDDIPENVRVIPIRADYCRIIGICMRPETDASGIYKEFTRYCSGWIRGYLEEKKQEMLSRT